MRTKVVPRVVVAALLFLAACTDGSTPIAVGTLERDRLDLVAEASEPVVDRPVPEGAYVKKGALLVKLDPTRLEAQVAQAESVRGQAKARLAELVRGPRRERIAEARAHLKGAQGRLRTARTELTRANELFPKGAISEELLDERRAAYDESLASRNATRATLKELLAGTTEEELAQAEAALAEADAALRDAQVRLGRLEVRAPTEGWVDALPYEVGERPPAGGVVAVLLAERAPYGRVYVPSDARARVGVGTPALIHVDGVTAPIRGQVRTVATEASFTPYFALTERDRGRLVYLAKVDLLDTEGLALPSGMPIEVELDIDEPPKAVHVHGPP